MAAPTPPFDQALAQFRARRYQTAFGSGAPQIQQAGGFSTLAQPPQQAPPQGLPQSISDQVFGIISPQLQNAADMINRRSQMASQLISGYTNSYKGMVGESASQMPKFYNPEIKIARGVAGYSRDALVNAGNTSAASLKADLSQAGVQGPGDINLAQQGAGAGAAAYGTGIAELDALIARKAAQSAESALEPSFAAGMGQQQQALVAAQLARQLSDLQGNITSQVPGLISDLTERQYQHEQDLASQQRDQRNYEEQVREFNLQRQDQLAQAGATAAEKKAAIVGPKAPTIQGRQAYWDAVAHDRSSTSGVQYVGTTTGIKPVTRNGKPVLTLQGRAAVQAGVKVGISQQTADTSSLREQHQYDATIKRLKIEQQNADTSAGRAAIAQQIADENTRHHKFQEQHPKTSGGSGGGLKPPTGSSISSQIDSWYTGKQTTKRVRQVDDNGKVVTDKNGAPIYKVEQGQRTGQLSYQQAYKRLQAQYGADQQAFKQAVGILDTKYKRGERGRPWVSVAQRQALAKAGQTPRARYYKGVAYLDDGQVAALKAAGMVPPPGEWTISGNVRHYNIKPGY